MPGIDYHRQLLDLPAAQKKALLYGDWSSYEGQVSTEYSYARHTCREFELPFEWDAWLGADDGYSAPACVLLFAYDKTHDRIFIVDEIYQRGLMPEELARLVLEMNARHVERAALEKGSMPQTRRADGRLRCDILSHAANHFHFARRHYAYRRHRLRVGGRG